MANFKLSQRQVQLDFGDFRVDGQRLAIAIRRRGVLSLPGQTQTRIRERSQIVGGSRAMRLCAQYRDRKKKEEPRPRGPSRKCPLNRQNLNFSPSSILRGSYVEVTWPKVDEPNDVFTPSNSVWLKAL